MNLEHFSGYANKCRILRQIQSNKTRKLKHADTAQKIAMVTVASFLTFIGFSGIDKITTYVNWIALVDRTIVEFTFNLLVFFIFVLVMLFLIFQFGRKQADSERAIVSLTNLSNYQPSFPYFRTASISASMF